MVPPVDISSSYSYRSCSLLRITSNSSTCVEYRSILVDVLPITPPFAYSYQCGSTLLTAYLPVYLYSTSLQILTLIMKLIAIFVISSDLPRWPLWIVRSFPGVSWPSYWTDASDSDKMTLVSSVRLIRPSQIVSVAMNNIILLLSFGLCSPVLCGYVTLYLCAHVSSWLMLIGRFVSFHRKSRESLAPSSPRASSTTALAGHKLPPSPLVSD